ncbi:MAG TPA: CehA/McbA family metallohydrolase [Gemmatimonadaceae bacterium]|nr:CehA/McbA family metallohydrolase [Gemmatimonadaceae bacterium]
MLDPSDVLGVVRATFTLLVAFAQVASAQRRDPPLAQVNVPHSYYWREMYIPQVTSGPSSLAWSPDGHEVIYSMQGTLWRQRLGTTVATQLTSDDTYDYQPDWSPNGRSVVYSAYDGRSIVLKLLDLPTGERRTLIGPADSSVNVDARWSPDGSRIAFVSTAYNSRWHVFVGRFANARMDSVARITEDRDSGLPRYYYSRFDHYLSPTWSPDGKELILVSNRGRIYGTGGLWRMEARPGAEMREILYEETTWKARPDWARDGKRVVYSSYNGRQWNQLWVTRSERADALQLTYGEFDATAPRWSPDLTRIGYISNEGGNTSLWTVAVPGGRRERVEPRTRRYLEPTGKLALRVVDSATRQVLPVRISVRGANGKFYGPDNRWRHADEAVMRNDQRFEYGYWHSSGVDTLSLPAGRYSVEIWRGPEWRTLARNVSVTVTRTTPLRIPVARIANLPAIGWWGGDVHVHMNYGGAYRNTPEHLAFMARAEGLHVVENLTVNKEQRIPDIATWHPGLLSSAPDLIIANGQEFHTGLWGHSAQLGLRENYLLPDYAGYPGTAFASLFPTNAAVFDLAHQQGALTGYVHPFDFVPDINIIQGGIPYELPVDVAAGKVDYLEVMGYSDPLITSAVWYRLLNCGFRVPAAAGTDAFPNFAQLRGPPGLVRVYAKTGRALEHRRWLDAIRTGHTFVTNAPLLTFSVNGREPGDELRLPFGTHRVRARVTLKSTIPIERLEIVQNGNVVARFAGRVSDTTVTLSVDRSGWYVARAYSTRPRLPVLDLYPFASTSPVYVEVGSAPRNCGPDAEYFLRWIDVLSQRVRADTNWNTPAERDRALSVISRAHEEFIRRR